MGATEATTLSNFAVALLSIIGSLVGVLFTILIFLVVGTRKAVDGLSLAVAEIKEDLVGKVGFDDCKEASDRMVKDIEKFCDLKYKLKGGTDRG